MKKKLYDIIENAVKHLGISIPEIVIELPKEESFGDLATPAAMSLAKILKKPPRKVAEDIVNEIKKIPPTPPLLKGGEGGLSISLSKKCRGAPLWAPCLRQSGQIRRPLRAATTLTNGGRGVFI